jgi:hypothetical protein
MACRAAAQQKKMPGFKGAARLLAWLYWRIFAVLSASAALILEGEELFGNLLVTSIQVPLLLKNSMLHNRKYFVLCDT